MAVKLCKNKSVFKKRIFFITTEVTTLDIYRVVVFFSTLRYTDILYDNYIPYTYKIKVFVGFQTTGELFLEANSHDDLILSRNTFWEIYWKTEANFKSLWWL